MKPPLYRLDPPELEAFLTNRSIALGSEANLAETLVEVLQKANEFVPSDSGSILLADPRGADGDRKKHMLTFIAAFGERGSSIVGRRIVAAQGIAGHVYTSGTAHHAHDVVKDPFFEPRIDAETEYRTRSVVAVPIRIANEVCGVLELLNRQETGLYSAQDKNLLEIFADYISISVQNALDSRHAQELAKRDNLTDLYNDRHLHTALTAAIEHARRESKDLAVLFVDLDFFKHVNDSHGHLAGSQVLREVGRLLAELVPPELGIAARYGGDEFVLTLPGVELDAAVDLAEDIRSRIETEVFCSHPGTIQPTPLFLRGITCSIGIATLARHLGPELSLDEAKSTLLHLADAAMYVSKETGRNRTAVAGEVVRRRPPDLRRHRSAMSTLTIDAGTVHEVLRRHLLVDGLHLVVDLEQSRGVRIRDASTGADYLDFFGGFSTSALGFNHPRLLDPEFLGELMPAALNKITNSDLYTESLAEFVSTFASVLPESLQHHLFFIEGGALAVENTLKTAFDWKRRMNLAAGRSAAGSQILHFRDAFHGRSGYTLSLTNTDPVKTEHFPKFAWPRVSNPALRFPVDDQVLEDVRRAEEQSLDEIRRALAENPHDIAAILIEPIQAEGGDHHFRPEFLRALRQIADESEVLLIFDEVQTGFATTGRWWCFEHFGVEPDLIAFGKKTQVCGIAASPRIDQIESVFKVPSRINSTWGGNLVDMVRCRRIIEVVRSENLLDNVTRTGARLLHGLERLAERLPGLVSNPRGRGFFLAFDLPDTAIRDRALRELHGQHLLALPTGRRGIRFRPPLVLSPAEADEGLELCERGLRAI